MRAAAHGTTLIELTLTLALIGILAAVAVPRAAALIDRVSVRGAAHDVLLALAVARSAATRRGEYASFVAEPAAGRIRVTSGGEVLLARDVAARHGVRLDATRDSITYAPGGMGWGAANTTIIVSRGGLADTVVVSRLGRVRH